MSIGDELRSGGRYEGEEGEEIEKDNSTSHEEVGTRAQDF